MILSFRTRLFVIAGLIVGTVLSVVLLLGWSRVLAFEVERLNERLCMEARRLATQPFRGRELARLETDVMGKLHLNAPEQLMLRFESGIEGANFQSANWRSALMLDGAQWQLAKSSNTPQSPDDRPDRPPPRFDENPNAAPGKQPEPPDACALASFNSLDAQGQQWRAARFTVAAGRSVVAVDLAAKEAELQGALTQALKLVIPLAIVLTALGAWLLSALTMRPVNRLRDAMKDVTQKALNRRLSSQGEDREFKVLIDAYNTMLARLEASFQQASRFSADAAHELKTPLTILQGRIEQALGKSDQPDMQADLTDLLDEVGRLSIITRKLLLLSQADAGWLALQRTPIDLSHMLDNMAADAHMLLTDQTLKCDIDRELSLQGDAVLLRQLFNNLVSNAARYCSAGGWIKLSAHLQSGSIEVVISNSTHVINPEDRARFFDRFYRGDASHNRYTEGTGLGLSLAREIARAHSGDLVLQDTALDQVMLRLTLQQV
jgi:two-component system, OmpR family, heavy metal sensor histidine kinase CusS